MSERLRVDIPIIVEGRYDKNTLSQIVDATILTTDGFAVFNSKQKQALLRRICSERGALLLTDPDGGGRQIRSFLLGILPPERVHQLHIPKVAGKERRKAHPSRSGLLGVEGMSPEVLRSLLLPFAADAPPRVTEAPLTKYELYEDGLSGCEGAVARRAALCRRLGLPDDLTADGMLRALQLLFTREQYRAALAEICRASTDADT